MKTVIYRETYQKTYEAEDTLTDTQAVTNVRERIMDGESGPEECVDSGGFVALSEEPGPGEMCVLVPFAYERYGKLPVIVPTGTPLEQIWSKAKDLLDTLPVKAMDYYSSYLPDSEEVDEDGLLFQRTEDGDVPFEVPVDLGQDLREKLFLTKLETFLENPDETEMTLEDTNLRLFYSDLCSYLGQMGYAPEDATCQTSPQFHYEVFFLHKFQKAKVLYVSGNLSTGYYQIEKRF